MYVQQYLHNVPRGTYLRFAKNSLREPDLNVRPLIQMDALDKSHPSSLQSQNHRRSPSPFAKEADALQQRTFGHAGRSEDHLLPRSQVFRLVNLVLVFNPHLRNALFQFRFVDYQPSLHVSVQAADRGRCNHAFRCAARSHDRMHPGSDHRRGNARREIAVANQLDARARLPDLGDEFFVPRTFEHHYHQVLHAAMHPPRDIFQVNGHRSVQFHRILARGPDYDFFHIAVGSVQQPTFFRSRQHRNRSWRSGGAEVRAFQRIDREIDLWNLAAVQIRTAHLLADIKHGRVVALALADHNRAVHGDRVHRLAHGLRGRLVAQRTVP